MAAYVVRRLLLMIPTLLGILIINFAIVQVAPGGPGCVLHRGLLRCDDVLRSPEAGALPGQATASRDAGRLVVRGRPLSHPEADDLTARAA